MTATQIINSGVPIKQWTTLENVFRLINLDANENIYIIPQATQFYFDTDNDVLFVRNTDGIARKLTGELKNGYVKINHDGADYTVKLSDGGIEDETIGRFHTVYGLEQIIGFAN